jgi:stage II sporulation protein D (peptidoglycan lytic transglycosylase)
VLALAAACAHPSHRPAPPAGVPATIRVQISEKTGPVIRTVDLERYVEAAALSEFAPASGDLATVTRMLEIQSIVSRTYAAAHTGRHERDGFDVCSTTHCQLYEPGRLTTSRWAPAAAKATARTRQQALRYRGALVEALFHADCGGHTSAPSAIWGFGGPPYLRAIADDGLASDPHATWTYEIPAESLRRSLNADARTAVGDRIDGVEISARDAAGRATTINLVGTRRISVRAEDVRQVLARAYGVRTIRSTRFEVQRRDGRFVFTGRGFGHGVGLCQAGALARLRAGASVGEVLAYYFPGTTVE